jgi:hypothetical protein
MRVEMPCLALQIPFQELRRELDRDEPVLFVRMPPGHERRLALKVEGVGAGPELHGLPDIGQGRLPVEVEAQFEAARMKTAAQSLLAALKSCHSKLKSSEI